MRSCGVALLALVCATSAAVAGRVAAPPLRVSFHHIHVNDHKPGHLLSYYGRLFDRTTTRPARIGSLRGIEAGSVFLLITPVRDEPPEEGGAGWHFGWGSISLDEAYDRHRMQEADLKLPMASFAKDLHLHLESEDPVVAANWYRDRFDARIVTNQRRADVAPSNPYYRHPAAIVELPGIALAIYQSGKPIASSRGQRIDHVAFRADLQQARASGFTILENRGRLDVFETMTVEGPDRLAIELVGPAVLQREPAAITRPGTMKSIRK